MTAALDHALVRVRNRRESAHCGASVPGLPGTIRFGPFLVALLVLAGCAVGPTPSGGPDDEAPHGIILVVGDGMGVAHFTLAGQLRGDDFQIGRLPHTALIDTASADQRATDSAASATAYATGARTNNGYLGLDADGRPQRTVVELAETYGLATGLVTTAPLADATPAAFVVHARDRHDSPEITRRFVSGGVDLLVSGGFGALGDGDVPSLEALAEAGGYQPAKTAAELRAAGDGPVLAVLPSGRFDGDSPAMSLPVLAEWAIERLGRDPEGFFLLIEHEGPDSASHANDRAALEASLRSLDETVGVAMKFARQRGDLLVIVVGDHETGGLHLAGTPEDPAARFGSQNHTAAWIPLFADGPGAAVFGGLQENTAVGQALLQLVRRMGE